MTYVPPFQGQLPVTSHDPLGASSCVAYAGAMAIAAATNGAAHPTGRQVREATGDTKGGLELAQVAAVMKRDYELPVSVGVFTRAIYEDRIASGRWGAVLIGGYGPVESSAFDACPGFTGNHAVFEEQSFDEDPLADGRRPGIYRFDGHAWPIALRREFAAYLRLSNGATAGPDHFEAILVPLPAVKPANPHVRVVNGKFTTYTVHAGPPLHAVGSSSRTLPVNSILPCSMREYPVVLPNTSTLPMRQVASGEFAGLWIWAHGPLAFSL